MPELTVVPKFENAALDARILEMLNRKDVRARGLVFAEICVALEVDPSGSVDSHFREVDRSLQRLRKAGKVCFRGRWMLP